jgi:molybdenum-dependent DNA-binding transcriptional regulator ModE
MGDELRMSRKERLRLVELEGVRKGRQKLSDAARRLGLSYRQLKRVWRRYRREGERGLVHRSRGRPSARAKPEGLREQCVALYQERYAGFGPTLASEKLAEQELLVDAETLRRWLLAQGLWQRQRRRGRHRQWRPRKERFGQLLQLDGSFHDWFGDGRPVYLMTLIDDATGICLARFAEQETTVAAMRLLWAWIARYGVPAAIYVDRKTVYLTDREPTLEEQLAGKEPRTAFGRACEKLGIALITAWSPQAKGRVERRHGVHQDRLVKELWLQGIKEMARANEFLEGGYLDQLNAKFARSPACPEDDHRPVLAGTDLALIFVLEERRTVANDWTVRYQNRRYQLTGPRAYLPRARQRVLVAQKLDGALAITYQGRALHFSEVALTPPTTTRRVQPAGTSVVPKAAWRPAANHPWRKPFSRRRRQQAAALAQEASLKARRSCTPAPSPPTAASPTPAPPPS